MTALPYGSWPSPVSAEDLAQSSLRLGYGVVDGSSVVWSEGHPEQGGRVSLWRRDQVGDSYEVTPPEANVRTGVNEYGGGDWAAVDGLIVYSSWPDGSLWLLAPDQEPSMVAPGDGLRYAAIWLDPARRLVLAVREDHRGDGEPCQTIVALDLDGPNLDGGTVIASGCDFYAHPSLSADSRVAWCEWNHPDMPWDSAAIVVAALSDPLARTVIECHPGVSALYPAWAPDGALLYLSDAGGSWTFRRWVAGSEPVELMPSHHDFCGPLWVLTPPPFTVIDATRIGCTWLADGRARVGVLTHGDGDARLDELTTSASSATVWGNGTRSAALFGFPDHPSALVLFDWTTGEAQTLRASSDHGLPAGAISVAEELTWASPDGPVHAWYYPPTNGDLTGTDGELPPVQVWSHGGPTSYSSPDFSVAVQFWTTRGIGILDVNYSGSSGYGRAYRDRLNGRWGLSDVRDCIAGAQTLVEEGRADPRRLSVRGGSAGGFTTLAALTSSDIFAAGISLYGIGDLEALATDTHKFESHYTERLVAPYPERVDVYRDRSPLHHLDRLRCPMLILQGADDKVVPPNQAEAMATAVRARGLPVRLRIFDGEGHGFRQAQTIIAVAEEALAFLGQIHGFTPR